MLGIPPPFIVPDHSITLNAEWNWHRGEIGCLCWLCSASRDMQILLLNKELEVWVTCYSNRDGRYSWVLEAIYEIVTCLPDLIAHMVIFTPVCIRSKCECTFKKKKAQNEGMAVAYVKLHELVELLLSFAVCFCVFYMCVSFSL